MDYASFKLNLINIGLDTRVTNDSVTISDGKEQIGKR